MMVLMMPMFRLEGQAGGSDHLKKGGGSNYLCLPNDPDNGKPYSYDNDALYGAEYELGGNRRPSGFGNLHDQDVPCAVCRRKGESSVLMIPGRCNFIQMNKINQTKMSISYSERENHDMILLYFERNQHVINTTYAK
jgi:hypothetical protein